MTVMIYGPKDGRRGLEASLRYDGRGNLFIQIPGSDHIHDYLINLQAWPRVLLPETNGARVHSRWLMLASDFADYIKGKVAAPERKNLYIAGHSMGGAVAAILPWFLTYQKCRVLTVNSPKAGNKNFVQWLKDNVDFRHYFNAGDIVRHLPVFYAQYPDNQQFSKSRPFWKAHNDMPWWWHSFMHDEDSCS